MNSAFFIANNNTVETWSFQTNSSSADTFSPQAADILLLWDFGDGSSYKRTSLGAAHAYTDNGSTKTITLRTYKGGISKIKGFSVDGDNLVGHLDMSGWDSLGGSTVLLSPFVVNNNPGLTGITHTPSIYDMGSYQVSACDITGTHDLTMFPNMYGTFWLCRGRTGGVWRSRPRRNRET